MQCSQRISITQVMHLLSNEFCVHIVQGIDWPQQTVQLIFCHETDAYLLESKVVAIMNENQIYSHKL